MAPTDVAAPPATGPSAVAAGSVAALRLTATLHALLAAAQPLLAGRYLDGDYDSVSQHGVTAGLVVVAAAAVGVAALVHGLRGGRWWPFAAAVALWWLEAVQTAMGYSANLAVHVPLGVAVVGLAVALAVWAWTPRARARRERGHR